MSGRTRNRQQGVALFFSLLALLLLSAIAAGLIFMSTTETRVNYNYRTEQVAYFAAKAGVEELRDRMMASNANTIAPLLPTNPPAPGNNQGVLYLLNEGNQPGSVQPWDQNNQYMDDELCHDGYNLTGMQQGISPDIRCTQTPNGKNWFNTVTSTAPWFGTAAALPYKWARVAMKLNASVQQYPVNAAALGTTQVCWNGVSELLLQAPAATCQNMTPNTNPVYMVTAFGVSGSNSTARRMVQAEVALTPLPPFPYGLFSTNPNCNSLSFTGNGWTDSYNSNNGSYAQTATPSGGDVGTFGNMSLGGNANIQGAIGVTGLPPYPTTVGPCPGNGVTGSGNNWKDQGIQALPANVTPASFPPPPAPNPPPPTTSVTYAKSTSLVPGTYGNIAVTNGTLTLAPGVYNINSLSTSGNANITVSPAGQVTLNIAGNGVGNTPVLSLTGQDVTNTAAIPKDFLVNYAGTGAIQLAGKGSTYMVVDAPNAALTVGGNGTFYGSVLGSTINYVGNGAFHFDKASALSPQSSGPYNLISYREITY